LVAVAQAPLPPSTSIAVMDALAPGWRSAPWWSGATLTPYSDAAAARLGQHGIPLVGWLLQRWHSLSTAYAALATDSPPSAVLAEARRWAPQVSEKTMLDLRDALLEAAGSLCKEGTQIQAGDTAQGSEVCAAASLSAHVTLRLPGSPTGCASNPVTDALVAIDAHLSGTDVALTVHPLGAATFCPREEDPSAVPSDAPPGQAPAVGQAPRAPPIGAAARAGRILRSLTDIGAGGVRLLHLCATRRRRRPARSGPPRSRGARVRAPSRSTASSGGS